VSNSNNHINLMGDVKYNLAAWRPGESSRFPYPRILLVPTGGCGPEEILRTAASVRAQYSNSHMFITGEASEQLDTRGPNSFLRKIPSMDGRLFPLFDVVIEVGPTASTLTKPSDKAQTPFAQKMLQR